MDGLVAADTPAWLAAAGTPWAITRPYYEMILAIAARQHDPESGRAEAARIRARRGIDAPLALSADPGEKIDGTTYAYRRGNVGVVRMLGPIFHRANMFTKYSGGVANELMARDVMALANDRKIRGILIEMDSPGGTVAGTDELSQVIYEARRAKPIATYASYFMASGGYYIGSAASEIVANALSELGSIGVVQVAPETYRSKGQVVIVSSKAPNKWKDPGSETGRSLIQNQLDDIHEQFEQVVARNLGVSARKVERDFGRGDTLMGRRAVEAGMAHRLGTFEETLRRLQQGRVRDPGRPRRRASSVAREDVMAKRNLGDRLMGWLSRQPEVASGEVEIPEVGAAPARLAPARLVGVTTAPDPAPRADDPAIAELKQKVELLTNQLAARERSEAEATAVRAEEAVAAKAKSFVKSMGDQRRILPAEAGDLERMHAAAQRDDRDRPMENFSRVASLEKQVSERAPHNLTIRTLSARPINAADLAAEGVTPLNNDATGYDAMAAARKQNDEWAARNGVPTRNGAPAANGAAR